jgi:hypothetical protein
MMAYPNRTDMQNTAQKVAKQAAKGQTYGKASEQMRSQSAVPMASGDVTTPSVPVPERPSVTPGMFGRLDRPTDRPGEPVTTGVNVGPGPSGAQLGLPSALGNLSPVEEIRALYELYPNDDLAALLENAINSVV